MARKKVWKDSLLNGVWVTTKGQIIEIGPNDQRYFHDRTKARLLAGAPLPWVWEHQNDESDTTPLSASDFYAKWAKNTGGHVHDVRLNASGQLELLMDVDEADISKLEAIKNVSPEIRHNWREANGPSVDDIGPYWPGQTIAHLAVTPMPVQYPQRPFDFEHSEVVSLSGARVDVSLSAASLKPKHKDESMPPDPMKKPGTDETPADGGAAPTEGPPGEDLESVGPVTPDAEGEAGGEGPQAAAMKELEHELSERGIAFHASAHDDMLTFIQHLITAVKTSKATEAGAEEPKPGESNPNPNPNDNSYLNEPEIAEGAPMQMSAAAPIPLTPREKKLLTLALKNTVNGLASRINTLHARGYIDDRMKAEWLAEAGTIKLSMADVSDDGTIKSNAVTIKVEAFERLMQTGKPGSFAKPRAGSQPGKQPDHGKPVSSSVSLSAAEEEVVALPYGDDEDEDRPIVPEIVNRISGGRYTAYKAKQDAKNGNPAA